MRIYAEDWTVSSKTSISIERKKLFLEGFFVKFKIAISARLWGVRLSSVGIFKILWTCIPPSWRVIFHIISIEITLSPFEMSYSIQYIIYHVFPPPGNPQILKFLVYKYRYIKPLYKSISSIYVVMASFFLRIFLHIGWYSCPTN